MSTTRLILAKGDAGAIVESFGQFVAAGDLVVGLVMFLVITIVQFLVIGKGAERVAEVAARFTLDAMPESRCPLMRIFVMVRSLTKKLSEERITISRIPALWRDGWCDEVP